MKEVTITSWCDGFLIHEDRVPATVERTPALDSETAIVDLCDECDKALDDLRALIAKGAPIPKKKKPGPKQGTPAPAGRVLAEDLTTECNQPGCVDERTGERYVAPTRSALRQHMKQKHGLTLGQAGLAVIATK